MLGLLPISGHKTGAVKGASFPILRIRTIPWYPVERRKRPEIRRPPGPHPSLAVSPRRPDPKKIRTPPKWENFNNPMLASSNKAPAWRRSTDRSSLLVNSVLTENFYREFAVLGVREKASPLGTFIESSCEIGFSPGSIDTGPGTYRPCGLP